MLGHLTVIQIISDDDLNTCIYLEVRPKIDIWLN